MSRCLLLLIVAAIVEASLAFSLSSSSRPLTLHRSSRRTTPGPSTVAMGDGRGALSSHRRPVHIRASADGNGDVETSSSSSSSSSPSSVSLAEKMKSWEATEDEIRASTLGGVVPGLSAPGIKGFDGQLGEDKGAGGRAEAFDVGLYIAFPIIVLSCLAFVFFPFLIGNIDITSVGPPPTS